MPVFQNTTTHSIVALMNGSRKTIKPGQIIDGPDNLSIVPGLTLISQTKKTVIPKITERPVFEPIHKPLQKNMTITFDNVGQSELCKEVDEELNYIRYMHAINRIPSVSIVILTKNSLKLITDCCESIFRMVRYQNITIVIADTGTTELPVKEYYNTLLGKCAGKNWNYQYIQLPNFHYSSNYNQAINQITTDYVLIQNNDTVALTDYVSEMMWTGLLRRVGSTGCRMLYPDKNGIQHDGQTIFNAPGLMFGSPSHINLRRPREQVPVHESYTDIVDGNTAAGVLMRTNEYKQIGGFDENYKDIFQDVDMMIKSPQILRKYNYCNKEAVIIHIDNATRFATGSSPKRQSDMWEDTHLIKRRINENGWQKGLRPKTFDFSIITLVYNLQDYEEFCASLKNQIGNQSVEVIGIPNFWNVYNSAYKALNSAADTANGKYIIFCHDDIVVPPNWITKIKNHIIELETQKINWGVIGPAGVFLDNNNSAFFLNDKNGDPLYKTQSHIIHDKPRYEVVSLDELCLITKKSNRLRFTDKQLSGFHFYGVNLCIEAKLKNLKIFAIDAYCYHKSDGYKNISDPDTYKIYEDAAKQLNRYAQSKNIKHWRSTTAMGLNNVITLYAKLQS